MLPGLPGTEPPTTIARFSESTIRICTARANSSRTSLQYDTHWASMSAQAGQDLCLFGKDIVEHAGACDDVY